MISLVTNTATPCLQNVHCQTCQSLIH